FSFTLRALGHTRQRDRQRVRRGDLDPLSLLAGRTGAGAAGGRPRAQRRGARAGAGRHAGPLRGRPVTAESATRTRRTMWRKAKSDLMMGVTVLATVITLIPLFIILAYLFAKGASKIGRASCRERVK